MSNKKLYRSEKDKLVSGVCGGIAEYLDIDPIFVRIVCALGIFFTAGAGVIMYFIAVLIMPNESEITKKINPVDIID